MTIGGYRVAGWALLGMACAWMGAAGAAPGDAISLSSPDGRIAVRLEMPARVPDGCQLAALAGDDLLRQRVVVCRLLPRGPHFLDARIEISLLGGVLLLLVCHVRTV